MIPSDNIAACNPYFKVSNFDWKSFGAGLLTGGVSSIIKDASAKKPAAAVSTPAPASADDTITAATKAAQEKLNTAKTKNNTMLYVGVGVGIIILIIIIALIMKKRH
ncbi:MAG: hypothetical protein PHX80_05445 [Candidatus Nanoarchaeia archaeon]|nr:hypothetical protein [Candidatus Nanoarchaeia archaeon]